METYIVTVDGTAYEVTVQKKSQLQPECTPQAAPAHPHTRRQKSQKSLLLPQQLLMRMLSRSLPEHPVKFGKLLLPPEIP